MSEEVQPKSVLLQPSDTEGCGFYRCLQPLTYLCDTNDGKYKALFSQKLLTMNQIKEINPIMIVTQRQFDEHKLKYYQEIKATYPKIKLVMDCDDLLWSADPRSPFKFSFEDKTNLKKIAKLCDQLTVSTLPLYQEFSRIATCPIRIFPNMIKDQYYREPRPRDPRRKLRIVYAGGTTHGPDLEQILNTIEMTYQKYEWIFLGFAPERIKRFVRFEKGVHILQYMDKLKELDADLSVAPLLINKFNECKSNVKLIEFGSIGVPVITTSIYPYQNNPGVKLSSSRTRDWSRAIDKFENEDYRMQIAKVTYDYARKFCLQDNYELLHDIYFKDLQCEIEMLDSTKGKG